MRGVPNPLTRKRNLEQNPLTKPGALEKMRKAQIGKKHTEATKAKMSASHKRFLADHPDVAARLKQAVWDRYTRKIKGKGWRTARLKALERDGYTCQGCGERKNRLLVHHHDYRGKNLPSQADMNNALDNLVTWCYKCHSQFHRHKSKDYRARMEAIASKAA
jgi:hypothetical protein